jgi:predicted deacylase
MNSIPKKKVLPLKAQENLTLSKLKAGEIHYLNIYIPGSSLGTPWKVPLIVLRGIHKGPTLGITAALHGNELNGLSTIYKLIAQIDPETFCGTLVCAPISNIPGYTLGQRNFSDGVDLNRIMPGRPIGKKPSEIYAYFFSHKIVKHFDYLLDLHTASVGRINSLYIRADLESPQCKQLAFYQNPHIIVQKYDEEGTLRGWANSQNIPAITIEIGNPNTFQHDLIDDCLEGILNTMRGLKMISGEVLDLPRGTFICHSSHWIYTQTGGIVDVGVKLTQVVEPGDVLATVYDIFGRKSDEIIADKKGVVIGKNTFPSCEAGTRLVHLGLF